MDRAADTGTREKGRISRLRYAANNATQLAKQKQIHWYQGMVLLQQL